MRGIASFNRPSAIAANGSGYIFVADNANQRIRLIDPRGAVSTIAGNGSMMEVDGQLSSAALSNPLGIIVDSAVGLVFSEQGGCSIRRVTGTLVSTLAGCRSPNFLDGIGSSACFNGPFGICSNNLGAVFIADYGNARIRQLLLPSAVVTTVGGLSAGFSDGFSPLFNGSIGIAVYNTGVLAIADRYNYRLRLLSCIPCPVSYYVSTGTPPTACPAGSYCPYNYTSLTCPPGSILCPKGSFSNTKSSNCTLCPASTFTSSTGSTSCKQCPGGHFCPIGTSSWARLNCGRGNYCPDGSGAPTPCPYQVPPAGGWGALQVQGPAFLAETAHCLNHCFWNFTSGDGMLSKC